VHLYAPRYPGTFEPPFDAFNYEPYTHAYFPRDHFDEVVQDGNWVFGRRGDAYVALYSYRAPEWVTYDPAVVATNGMVEPFDLRANGGPDNTWIVECGRQADAGSFDAFRTAIAASAVSVTVLPRTAVDLPGGFDVVYESPSQGRITFGWDASFTIDGEEMPITGYPRRDNPWAHTAYGDRTTEIAVDGYRVALDFAAGTRTVSAP
jgi:hypothetical protein